jgi:hypothetical protein
MHHETGHLSQINEMGAAKFYGRTAKEYIRHSFSKEGFLSVYYTPGTLEYAANYYAYSNLGYFSYYNSQINNFSIIYQWPF